MRAERDIGLGIIGFGLIAAGRIWHKTHFEPLGNVVVNALSSSDETLSSTAAELLDQDKRHATTLIVRAIENNKGNLPTQLTILAGVCGLEQADIFERLKNDTNPLVAEAARDGIDILQGRGIIYP